MIKINGKNFQDSEEVKQYIIIELMKKYKDSKEKNDRKNLVDFLQECSINTDLNEKNNNNGVLEYRFCGTTNSRYCGYFINKNGQMKIIEINGESNFWDIPEGTVEKEISNICNVSETLKLKNGYICTKMYKNGSREICLALDYDIYKFMEKAKWLEFKNNKKIAEDIVKSSKFSHDRLEIHHINNNPNDNRDVNLIYLPRSIHCCAHKYINNTDNKGIYTFELTVKEHEKVVKYIDRMGKIVSP